MIELAILYIHSLVSEECTDVGAAAELEPGLEKSSKGRHSVIEDSSGDADSHLVLYIHITQHLRT